MGDADVKPGRQSPETPISAKENMSPAAAREADMPVLVERDGAVGLIRLNAPPENRLTTAMRAALGAALSEAVNAPEVEAIVLLSYGASFCAGFPHETLSEGMRPGRAKDVAGEELTALCDQIEASPKPVIAALHGVVSEAGLALALAAHYRVAGRNTQIVSPEVRLGLVPTGGVTQRLPRLIGGEAALDLLLSGRPMGAERALELRLVDQLAAKRGGAEALALARDLIAKGTGPRPTRNRQRGFQEGPAYFQAIAKRRAEQKRTRQVAPKEIVACVEAALMLPFEAGLTREAVARADSLAAPESQALRHAAWSERLAARRPKGLPAPDPDSAPVTTLGIVGTTGTALGMAIAALDHGLNVRLLGSSADGLVQAEQRLMGLYTRAFQQGQISEATFEARKGALRSSLKIGSLAEAELVFEATGGPTQTRARLLSRVEEFLPEHVVLATGAERGFAGLATELAHPERFLGLHVFAPVHAIRVVELVRPREVSDAALARAHGFVKQIGKLPVTLGPKDGLIANTLQESGWAAVDVLLLMGARPAQIDRAVRDYGFPAGPCETMDALGLNHLRGAVPQYLAELGFLGRGAGQGFFTYTGGVRGDDAVTEAQLAALREEGGIPPVSFTDEEIVTRLILAEANAGAQLLQSGAVDKPADIDVVMMLAKGYPRDRGGPMKAADLMGLLQAEKRLLSYENTAPDIWAPATLWRDLVKNGDNFEKLNFI